VLVVGPAVASSGSGVPLAAVDALDRLVAAGAKPRPAAAVVADLMGTSANELYAAHVQGRRNAR
jgi:16S rRNA (cytidine1402-2'-O)-methyltransferase